MPTVLYAIAPISLQPSLPSHLPSTVDPSQIPKRLESSIKPTIGNVNIPTSETAAQASTTSEVGEVKFQLKKIVLTGNTVFTQAELTPLFSSFLYKNISLSDLQKITQQITLKYRNAGYVLSKAILPAQVIENGNVKIQIIEGYIANTSIEGDAGNAQSLLERYGTKLKTYQPLNVKNLERFALLANDIPGMSAKTILHPAVDSFGPGSVTLNFIPEFSKANGFISFDNRGTKYLGPNEFSLGGAINSLLRAGDQFGVQGLVSSELQELQYANVYTKQPLGSNGLVLSIGAGYNRSKPAYLLRPLEVEGQSKELTVDLQYPLVRSRKQSLFITTGFNWLNNKTDINAFNANYFDDRIRSLRLGTNFYLNDKLAGANQFSLQLSKGLAILGASKANQSNLSRVVGDPEYTKLNFNVSRLQGLSEHISAYAGAISQYAFTPLLTAEQFSYGGSQFGQAYDPSEIIGDKGVAAKLEFRYDTEPGLFFLRHLQYAVFYDIGKIWNIKERSVTGFSQQESAASAGIGLRVNFTSYLYGTAAWVKPLTRDPSTELDRTPRIFVSLVVSGKTSPVSSSDKLPIGYSDSQATNGPVAQANARYS